MIDSDTQVVPATPEVDINRLADALARAFYDDPVTIWANPGERSRLRRTRRFFVGRLRTLLPHELSTATAQLDAGAIWSPPDAWQMGMRELLHDLPAFLTLNTPTVLRGMSQVEARHPKAPHYYLAILGVDPPLQGQGIGSKLIAPMLERCDAEGEPAYLETATERNVAFYTRHGFKVTDEVDLPRGPRMWLMWREPR